MLFPRISKRVYWARCLCGRHGGGGKAVGQVWKEMNSQKEVYAMGTEEMEGLILKRGLFREGFLEEAAFDLSVKG